MRTLINITLPNVLFSALLMLNLFACGGGPENPDSHQNIATDITAAAETTELSKSIGVGPINKVELGEINHEMVKDGLAIFEGKCTACHKIEDRYIGPAIKGVTERRTPEWIMNMILNPEGMVQEDPQAKVLLSEYLIPMMNQNLTEDEARKILEYFRTLD